MKNQRGIRGAKRMLACQTVVTLLCAMIAMLIAGITAAKTVILGGLVSIVPNALFATILFKHQGAQVAKQIVKGFYKGEAAKLLLTIFMFGLVFSCFKIYPLLFFAVYILVQMLIWFAPLLFNNN